MKFNLRYLANLFVAALLFCATGCKDDDTSGPEMPAVKIAPGATTASSISFTATPEYADAAAYVCVEKGMLIPSAENILANGTALTLDKESLVEVKNLKDTTVYVVAAAAKMGDQIGNVVSVEIKTGAYDGVLNIIDATQSVISYHIKPTSDSRYYHLAIPKAYWDYQIEGESASEAERIKTAMLKQLGSVDRGEKTYTLTDGEKDVHKNLTQVFPATEYLLVKADCDAEGNLRSALDTLTFETAENSVSAAEITVELSRITSSGVTIRCVPGAILNRYYIGIEETAVVNQYIEKYGKEAWKRVLMAGSQPFEHTISTSVSGKKPTVDYTVYAVGIDDDRNFTDLFQKNFTTKQSAMPTVALDYELKDDGQGRNPYNTIFFNIKTTDADMIKYVTASTAEITEIRNELGLSDEEIVTLVGDTLPDNYTDLANGENGLPFSYSGLSSGTSYTLIVQALNGEYSKVEVLSASTQEIPRVESQLFDKLPGEWSATINGLGSQNQDSTYTFDVTIAAGVNEATTEEYRKHNLLVCLGLADFNYYGPEELVANNFPQSVANEAYGPKWFLQIAEGDEVTVLCDTERNLFDWAQQGTFYLMGINEQVVFEPFPVEVSDDFNTIKVKTAVYEGADYFMGAGYLVSSNRVSLAFIGTSEMTLTRKADGNTVLNQGLRMPGRHSEFTLKKPGSLLERISCEKVHFDVTPAAEAHSYESYEQPQMKLMEVPFAAFDEIRKEVK